MSTVNSATSTSTNDADNFDVLKHALRNTLVVVISVMMPFIVILNSFIISIVYTFRRLHRAENYLVAAIAGFDLLYGVVSIPLYILSYSEITIFTGNKYGCIGMYSLILMVTIGRCLFLQWLVLDRYVAVMHPFWHQRHVANGDLYKYTLGFIIAFLVLLGLMPMFGVNEYIVDESKSTYDDCSLWTIWPVWYTMTFYNLIKGLTALIPSIFNIIMFRTVRKQRKSIDSAEKKGGPSTKPATISRKTSSARTSSRVSMSVYFVFLVFYVPTFCTILLRGIDKMDGTEHDYLIKFDYFAYMWEYGFLGFINPILMIYLKTEYRKALAKMIKTPCWLWCDLKYDKLGYEFTTEFYSSKSSKGSVFGSGKEGSTQFSEKICEQNDISSSTPIPDLFDVNNIKQTTIPVSKSTDDSAMLKPPNGTSCKVAEDAEPPSRTSSGTSIREMYLYIQKVVSFKETDDVQPRPRPTFDPNLKSH